MKTEFTKAELDEFFGGGLIIFGPGPRPPKPETKPLPKRPKPKKPAKGEEDR